MGKRKTRVKDEDGILVVPGAQSTMYDGCFGALAKYPAVERFLDLCFDMNLRLEGTGRGTFATCIWGNAGVGKTTLVNSFTSKSVEWNGKRYDGWRVYDVPLAQIEEMGEIHGMPMDCILVRKGKSSRWVTQRDSVLSAYLKDGWEIDVSESARTITAPPEWVPREPGPSILLFDDWNRALQRVLKGVMQLIQNHKTIAWSLPPGCQIAMTANPDQQDYYVSALDSANLTRIRHVTLLPDKLSWAAWAASEGLDPRGIEFILKYEEMLVSGGRTNPRTLADFFKFTKGRSAQDPEIELVGQGIVEPDTVVTFQTFVDDKEFASLLISPEEVLNGKKSAFGKLEELVKSNRFDVISVVMHRLATALVDGQINQTKRRLESLHRFLTMDCLPEDLVYSLCTRLSYIEDDAIQDWIVGSEEIQRKLCNVSGWTLA